MLVKSNQYIPEAKVSKPSKSGIRVISEMPTHRIMWFVLQRHSRGLKTLTIFGLVGYIAWDKVVRLFI